MLKEKSKKEIKIMREGGQILRKILKDLEKFSKPGRKFKEIDKFCEKLLARHKVQSATKGYKGFPGNICLTKNHEIVHGIPFGNEISDGDLIGIDLMIKHKGLITDSAISFVAGKSNELKDKLIKVCRECLEQGIAQSKSGNTTGDIGHAIQKYAEKQGFSVVRDLVGHGVGYGVHEDLIIPNYGSRGSGEKIKEGMTFAIEPMICVGDYETELDSDGWTYKTADRSLSCHFEHTVVAGKKGGIVLT